MLLRLVQTFLGLTTIGRTANTVPENWLYSSELNNEALKLLERPDIVGAQVLYTWRSLEPAQGEYDFSEIGQDLASVHAKGKKLWLQLQDRTFSVQYVPTPKYMSTPLYSNGSVPQCDGDDCDTNFVPGGWVAAQWNPHVRERYHALLSALSQRFDGDVYGINFPETAITPQPGVGNYSDQAYFDAELDNAGYGATVFCKTFVVQYVNFWADGWANENNRFTDSFDFYAAHGVGVGGPDLVPNKTSQMKNSYPFIREYQDRVPISVISVQEPDLAAINPETGEHFTKAEFVDFAQSYLGVKAIFWALSSPWLNAD